MALKPTYMAAFDIESYLESRACHWKILIFYVCNFRDFKKYDMSPLFGSAFRKYVQSKLSKLYIVCTMQ